MKEGAMDVIGLTGIGMTVGSHIVSFEGSATLFALLLGTLVVSATGILSSRAVSGWLRGLTARPALRLHAAPAGGR
jgi:hypothetical protein